ncbi:hypothetical protein LNP13_02440 [Apilactobacillus kunkeei]|uniref:hypothetical protein n=1 Tax=Apilactobacillus kunkeei TaxID=148814 RepID=UPI00200B57F6|nr:hypothetical protein [Apilactobacillus kunkeei]MCK8635253.1 hypothetical protein [Apilactobacillus kunkeei]
MDKNAKKILVLSIEMIAYNIATSMKISICGIAVTKFAFKITCKDIASLSMLNIPHRTDSKKPYEEGPKDILMYVEISDFINV